MNSCVIILCWWKPTIALHTVIKAMNRAVTALIMSSPKIFLIHKINSRRLLSETDLKAIQRQETSKQDFFFLSFLDVVSVWS